jgi:hypothetical protein
MGRAPSRASTSLNILGDHSKQCAQSNAAPSNHWLFPRCLIYVKRGAVADGNSGSLIRQYDPAKILLDFYRRAPLDTKYMSILPTDKGIWCIELVNESLALLEGGAGIIGQSEAKKKSRKTIGNRMRLAEELGLSEFRGSTPSLSSFGKEFVRKRDTTGPPDLLSPGQAELIRAFILANPFFSGVTYGILVIVGCVFEFSKNTYPVPRSLPSRHFIDAAGLHFRWGRDKAANKGVRMYSNYAIELGLPGKIGGSYFVTPSGLKFVLLLNMHKSLQFIENMKAIR